MRLTLDRPVWLWGRDDVLKLMSHLPLFAKGSYSIPPGFTLTYALKDGRGDAVPVLRCADADRSNHD